MHFRPMTTQDHPRIIELAATITGVRFTDEEDATWHATFLQRNPTACFVAEQAERLVGFVYCGNDGRRATIYHLAVAESQRQHGIGKGLMQLVDQAIAEQGIAKANLMVFTDNHAAIAFYRHLDWHRRDDLLVMSKHYPSNNHH